MSKWMRLALWDELKHFVSSGFAGLVAYYSTWIILRFWLRRASRSRGKTWHGTQDGPYTSRFCWSVAVFASFLAHCWLDGLL